MRGFIRGNCVITSVANRTIGGSNPQRRVAPTGATLRRDDCKLYEPVVTLSKDDENKMLTNLKSGFRRVVHCNKYMSQVSAHSDNNNLNILVDPTFTNVNRLFVLAYESDVTNIDNKTSFSIFYLPKVIIKDFNVIIDKLPFFDLPVRNEEEAYEKIIDMVNNSEYNTGNLLNYDYFKKFYKLVAIDLSKQQVLQENKDLIQQISFIGRVEQEAAIFVIIEKKKIQF